MNRDIAEGIVKVFLFLAGAIVGAYIASKYKDYAYKNLIKSHDKETAEKMADEFKKKADELLKENKNSSEETSVKIKNLKKKFNSLCEQFGIPPYPAYT